jgi:hypothetical protein
MFSKHKKLSASKEKVSSMEVIDNLGLISLEQIQKTIEGNNPLISNSEKGNDKSTFTIEYITLEAFKLHWAILRSFKPGPLRERLLESSRDYFLKVILTFSKGGDRKAIENDVENLLNKRVVSYIKVMKDSNNSDKARPIYKVIKLFVENCGIEETIKPPSFISLSTFFSESLINLKVGLDDMQHKLIITP